MNKCKNIIITAIAGISVMCLSLPAYAAGFDINQDNDVNVNDVTYLQTRLSENDTSSELDLNGDGIVNVNDVSFLQFEISRNSIENIERNTKLSV